MHLRTLRKHRHPVTSHHCCSFSYDLRLDKRHMISSNFNAAIDYDHYEAIEMRSGKDPFDKVYAQTRIFHRLHAVVKASVLFEFVPVQDYPSRKTYYAVGFFLFCYVVVVRP